MKPGQHRPTARVLIHSNRKQFLLLLTRFDPEVQLPPRWLIPGGGIDKGESASQTAVRELFEETGLRISEQNLGPVVFQETGKWHWGDGANFHTYDDQIFELDIQKLRLTPETLVVDKSHWTQDEHRDVIEIRWWSITELLDTKEPVSPQGLTDWLRAWL